MDYPGKRGGRGRKSKIAFLRRPEELLLQTAKEYTMSGKLKKAKELLQQYQSAFPGLQNEYNMWLSEVFGFVTETGENGRRMSCGCSSRLNLSAVWIHAKYFCGLRAISSNRYLIHSSRLIRICRSRSLIWFMDGKRSEKNNGDFFFEKVCYFIMDSR